MAVTQELVAGEDACLAVPGFWSVQPVLSSPYVLFLPIFPGEGLSILCAWVRMEA